VLCDNVASDVAGEICVSGSQTRGMKLWCVMGEIAGLVGWLVGRDVYV
jgi:hypothetical protein